MCGCCFLSHALRILRTSNGSNFGGFEAPNVSSIESVVFATGMWCDAGSISACSIVPYIIRLFATARPGQLYPSLAIEFLPCSPKINLRLRFFRS